MRIRPPHFAVIFFSCVLGLPSVGEAAPVRWVMGGAGIRDGTAIVVEAGQAVHIGVEKDFSLARDLTAGETGGGAELFFVIDPCMVALDAYLNGEYLGSRGRNRADGFRVLISERTVFALPSRLLGRTGSDRLELRCRFEGSDVTIPSTGIADAVRARYLGEILNPLNTKLYVAFAAMSGFAAFALMLFWIRQRHVHEYLWFAGASALLTAFFAEFGLESTIIPYHLLRTAAKASLPLAAGCLLFVFSELIRKKQLLRFRAVMLAALACFSLWIALQYGDDSRLESALSLSLPATFVAFIASAGIAAAGTIRGVRSARPLLAGIVAGLACATFDFVGYSLGWRPAIWLAGLGFFFLDIAVFSTLALRAAVMHTELSRTAGELGEMTDMLRASNDAFARFVPMEFIELLGKKSPSDVRLGDQIRTDMTILFSDIRSFTALSERMSPEEAFAFLNAYFHVMTPLIRAGGGIVDKYMGDAIMALFPDDPFRAMETAVSMREALVRFNAGRKAKGGAPIEIGIGIHAGTLMLGTIGEEARMDTTVISDAVNVASRLESMTKAFGVPVLISGALLERVPDARSRGEYRYLGQVRLKGKSSSMPIFELVTRGDPLRDLKLRTRERFERAVFSYDSGDVLSAAVLFRKLLTDFPADPAVRHYLELINETSLEA